MIEAVELISKNLEELQAFMASKAQVRIGFDRNLFMIIPTLEGEMRAEQGDWVIKGVKGEFYPCKPDIFEQTHERVG